MTPAKCRAARALLDMSISIIAMRKALEKAGVEFIEDGVKLRKGRG